MDDPTQMFPKEKVKASLESDIVNPGLLSAPAERVQMRRVSFLCVYSSI